MPEGFSGVSTVYDDKIYVVGAYADPSYWDGAGFNITGEATTLVQVYDPEKDVWAVVATDGSYCIEGLFTISTSGLYAPPKIYCLSYSQTNIGPVNFIGLSYEQMAFDLEAKSWDRVAGLPVMRAGFGLVVVDDLVYVIGGYNPDFSYFSGIPLAPIRIVSGAVERYTPLGFGRVVPEVSVLSLEDRGVYAFRNVALEFGLNRPVVWMGYSLDDGANVTVTGNVTLPELSYGQHSVRVFAEDKYGNIGASETITFSVTNASNIPNVPLYFIVIVGVGALVVCGGLFLFLRKRRRFK